MSKAYLPDPATIDTARIITASLPTGDVHLSGVDTPLPAQAAAMLREMLTSLAAGEPVALITASSELSPTEAAEFLKVSRGFVTKLMDDGTLPFHQVGSHRRIPGAAVATYKATQQRQSKAAMDELVRLSQEMGGYDDQPPMLPKSGYRNHGGSSR
jgi:excisionase family DNA binding protein